MNYRIQNTGTKTYMVFTTDQPVDDIVIGMMQGPKEQLIRFLPLSLQITDSDCEYCYDITGLSKLSQFAASRITTAEHLRRFVSSVCRMCEECDDFLIPQEHLLLNAEYCYLHPDGDVRAACLPFLSEDALTPMEFVKSVFLLLPDILQMNTEAGKQVMNSILRGETITELRNALESNVPATGGAVNTGAPTGQRPNTGNPGGVQGVSISGGLATPVPPGPVSRGSGTRAKPDVPPVSKPASSTEKDSKHGFLSFFQKSAKADTKPAKPAKAPARPTSSTVGGNRLSIPGQDSSLLDPIFADPAPAGNTAKPQSVPARPQADPVQRPASQPAQQNRYHKEVAPAGGYEVGGKDLNMTIDQISATMILDNDGTNGGDQGRKRLTLQRVTTGELIPVTSALFTLGRSADSVDYAITDNGSVSRHHATIRYKDGAYYIEDNNSHNKTRVNGAVIAPQTQVLISHNDTVDLGSEYFIVLES